MGSFEDVSARIGSILRTTDIRRAISRKAVIVMCADNGIVDEGISQSGYEVTMAVAKAMGEGKSSVGKLAAVNDTKVIPVDIGIRSEYKIAGVLDKKIRQGTRNFAVEPAMTKDELYSAIQFGIDLLLSCKEQGYGLVGLGEMGIGNTTTSAAVAVSIALRDIIRKYESENNAKVLALDIDSELDRLIEEFTGRGAGLSDDGLARKKKVIRDAVLGYRLYEKDVLDILMTVGGLDIAGLVGVILGGAYYGVPIVLDGLISAVAALVACSIAPEAKDYIIASHMGKEPAMRYIMEKLKLTPVIYAGLALGEGTGAVMFFSLLDIALAIYDDPTTFDDIEIEAYKRLE